MTADPGAPVHDPALPSFVTRLTHDPATGRRAAWLRVPAGVAVDDDVAALWSCRTDDDGALVGAPLPGSCYLPLRLGDDAEAVLVGPGVLRDLRPDAATLEAFYRDARLVVGRRGGTRLAVADVAGATGAQRHPAVADAYAVVRAAGTVAAVDAAR